MNYLDRITFDPDTRRGKLHKRRATGSRTAACLNHAYDIRPVDEAWLALAINLQPPRSAMAIQKPLTEWVACR